MTILLATINARYAHASLGMRCLYANMGELQPQTQIIEFVLGTRTADIAEKLLSLQPRIIGLGVYIWNAEESAKLVALLKRLAPAVKIVLGGPEVSHESAAQPIVQQADYLITGWGDVTFPVLCQQILAGPQPLMKIHAGEQPPLAQLALPYAYYSETDIAHRILYVEGAVGITLCLLQRDRYCASYFVCGSIARLSVQMRILSFITR